MLQFSGGKYYGVVEECSTLKRKFSHSEEGVGRAGESRGDLGGEGAGTQ